MNAIPHMHVRRTVQALALLVAAIQATAQHSLRLVGDEDGRRHANDVVVKGRSLSPDGRWLAFSDAAGVYLRDNQTGAMKKGERLDALMAPGGIQDCGNAQNCVAVCPKSIPLTRSIARAGRQTTVRMRFES